MGLATQADRADESFPVCTALRASYVQVLEIQEKIESLCFSGNQVYVGTAVGNLFQFGLPSHVDSEDKDLRAVQVGVVRLSTRRPVEQVCATERFVFTLLDGVLNVLPADIQSAAAVELCKDVKQICLHSGSSGEEVSGEICVATRKKLIIFANKGTTFEQRQEAEQGLLDSILKLMRRVTIPASLEEDEKELVIDVDMGIANESGVCVWDSALCLGEMLIKEQRSLQSLQGRMSRLDPSYSGDHADAIELDWGDAPAISGINTVIMSDCVYLREACPLLLETLNALAPDQIIWAQEMRGIEED
ncbi:unnamed protein product [Cladocopium goreaui]|uniref:Uncharacterized protein n=1 Tax=Cladocopium goreaui TaxID=2562237 RepID=A0A9P1CVA5_9DINO|nr:unnamed protein product [Cladocopium goreaui]